MKTAIITDTNSGMSAADAKEHGIILLPMPFNIDGIQYMEQVDLTHEQFYELQERGAEIHTSQPAAGDVIDLWTEVLKEYDEIVHIPMSSSLSGSCQSAALYAGDFDGRVRVVDNRRISVTQRQSAIDAKMLSDSGASAAEIKQILEETAGRSHIYITVDTMTYLKKGGRVTASAAAIAGILGIKPVLSIEGGKLDAFAKCRGMKSAKSIMEKAVLEHVENEFGGAKAEVPGAWIGVAHTRSADKAEALAKDAEALFPGFDIHIDELPISVACHIGPGSLALTCTEVLKR